MGWGDLHPTSPTTLHHHFKQHIRTATQYPQARCPSTARYTKQLQDPPQSNFTRNDPNRIIPPRRTLTRASRRTTRRTGATTTFAATTPGAHSDASIPNIRHNGPNTRRACGEAAINPAISGSANRPRICPAKQAASPGTNGNNHPNPRGNPGLATRAARTPHPAQRPRHLPHHQPPRLKPRQQPPYPPIHPPHPLPDQQDHRGPHHPCRNTRRHSPPQPLKRGRKPISNGDGTRNCHAQTMNKLRT